MGCSIFQHHLVVVACLSFAFNVGFCAAANNNVKSTSIKTAQSAINDGATDTSGALYYKLDGSELNNKTTWPKDFLKYSIFVVNPGLFGTTTTIREPPFIRILTSITA